MSKTIVLEFGSNVQGKRMVISIINIRMHKTHNMRIIGLCGIRNGVIILDFYKLYVW